MLKWALILLAISLAAGALGFTGVSSAAAGVSKLLFVIAFLAVIILVVMALLAGELIL